MRLLLVEDDPDDVLLIRTILARARQPVELTAAARLSTALTHLGTTPTDLVLLDLSLPDSTGGETLHAVIAAAPAVPVVVLTGLDDERVAQRAVREGAQDYLVKGQADGPLLVRTLRYAIERKQAANDLRERDALASAVFQQTADGIFLIDLATHTVLDSNPAFQRLIGYSASDLRTMRLEDFVLHDPGEVEATLAHLVEQRRPLKVERRYRRRDGQSLYVEVSACTIQLARREAVCLVLRDITQRRRDEDARRRLATAIEVAAEAIAITDRAGIIGYVNRAFEAITGYSREAVLGQSIAVLPSDRQSAAEAREISESILRGQAWRGQVTCLRRDGSLYTARLAVSPVRDAEGGVAELVISQQDVTSELELQSQLSRSQTMQAVGQLAAGIAHDFRNVLMAVLSFVDLIGADMTPDDPRRESVEEVQKVARRGAGLAQQLLSFCRQEGGAKRVADLNELTLDISKLLRRTLGDDVSFELDLCPELSPVLADPVHLQQILVNLVVNARDAMPTGGRLSVHTANVSSGGTDRVRLSVCDTGIGVPKENAERIFQPFFTTKSDDQNSGLGLARVQSIVDQLGGAIHLDSEPGHGSTFTILLPVAPAPSGEPPEAPAPGDIRGRSESILVAADDPGLRGRLATVLQAHGYHTLCAATGAAAIACAEAHLGPIHLLLAELVLPGMSGPRLAGRLSRTRPSLRLLYLTELPDDRVRQQGVDPARTLERSAPTELLLSRVRLALDEPADDA